MREKMILNNELLRPRRHLSSLGISVGTSSDEKSTKTRAFRTNQRTILCFSIADDDPHRLLPVTPDSVLVINSERNIVVKERKPESENKITSAHISGTILIFAYGNMVEVLDFCSDKKNVF
jgi:hypothetical protein